MVVEWAESYTSSKAGSFRLVSNDSDISSVNWMAAVAGANAYVLLALANPLQAQPHQTAAGRMLQHCHVQGIEGQQQVLQAQALLHTACCDWEKLVKSCVKPALSPSYTAPVPCSAWALQEAGRKVLAACHQLGMDKCNEGADSISALLLEGLVFCIIPSAAVETSQQPCQKKQSHLAPLVLTLPEALAALGHLVQQLPDYTAQLQQLLGEEAWEELSLGDVEVGTGFDLPHLGGISHLDVTHWYSHTLGQTLRSQRGSDELVPSQAGSNGSEPQAQDLIGQGEGQGQGDRGSPGSVSDERGLPDGCREYAEGLHHRFAAAVAQWRSHSWEVLQPDAQRDAQRAALLELLR
jgi:hypothetical protein